MKKISVKASLIALVAVVVICVFLRWTGSHNVPRFEKEGYSLCQVITDANKRDAYYWGVISDKEYAKWIEGKPGTLWIETATQPQYGYRLNIVKIISIIKLPWSEYRKVLRKG